MNWWEWVFSGTGVLFVGLLIEWLRRRSRSSGQEAALTAQGARVDRSPVASGSGITQTVNSPTNIYMGLPHPATPAPAKAPGNIAERKPNIAYVGTEMLCIVEYDHGVFVPRENTFPAVVIKFSNDAVMGASTKSVSVKGTIVYRDAGNEILRVMGAWLEQIPGHVQFEVDSSHKLIICFVLNDELCTLKKFSQIAHRREWWQADLQKFGSLEKFTALVRLTNSFSGYCYFEGEFEVHKKPLIVSLIKTA